MVSNLRNVTRSGFVWLMLGWAGIGVVGGGEAWGGPTNDTGALGQNIYCVTPTDSSRCPEGCNPADPYDSKTKSCTDNDQLACSCSRPPAGGKAAPSFKPKESNLNPNPNGFPTATQPSGGNKPGPSSTTQDTSPTNTTSNGTAGITPPSQTGPGAPPTTSSGSVPSPASQGGALPGAPPLAGATNDKPPARTKEEVADDNALAKDYGDHADENKRQGYSRNDEATTSAGTPEDCGTSARLGDYGCGATHTTIETAKVVNGVSQAAGSIATAAMGQAAQERASAEGTQSAAMHAAAETQRTSGKIQVGTGAVNTAMGVIQMVMGSGHSSNAKEIEAGTKNTKLEVEGYDKKTKTVKGSADGRYEGDGTIRGENGYVSAQGANGSIANAAIDNFHLQGAVTADVTITEQQAATSTAMRAAREKQLAARNAIIKQKSSDIRQKVDRIGDNAIAEQKAASREAMAGGFTSLVTGAGQLVSGGFSIAAANELDDAANKLKNLENQTPVIGFQPLGAANVGPGDALAPHDGNSITGDGSTPDVQAAQDDTKTPDKLGDLGRPVGAIPDKSLTSNGPGAGKFNGAAPGAGGGGAAGGFSPGGGTQAAQGDNADPQSKMADQGKGGGYDAGGSAMAAGVGGGNGADKGPDLSGLLAQFLPKKDEEQKNPNGIMDFGSRGPASEGPISLLDRNTNIFERIHSTYQDKNRRGNIGM